MVVRRLMPPVLLRRIFIVSALLCMIVPVTWVLLRRDPLEQDTDYTKHSWTNLFISTMIPHTPQNRPTTVKRPVDQGLLLLYKYRSSSDFRHVKMFLKAHRINHDMYLMSMTRHAPKLVRVAGPSHSVSSVGRYRYIIVLDVFNFISEGSIHGLFTEYCRGFDAVMMLIANGHERNIANLLPAGQTFEDDMSMFVLSTKVHYLKIHQSADFVYTKDGGPWHLNTNVSINKSNNILVSFWPHKRSQLSDAPDAPYSEHEMNKRLQILASAHYTDPLTKSVKSLPVAVIDLKSTDAIQRIYFGVPVSISITKLLLLEVLHMYSKPDLPPVLRTGLKRWIQVDIDDVFVAPMGSKMKKHDVEVRL